MTRAAPAVLTAAAAAAALALAAGAVRAAPGGEPTRPETIRPETIRLIAGGDVAFGRETPRGWRPVGGADPLAAVAPLLRAADLAVVNLETPLCDALPTISAAAGAAGAPVRFRSPPAAAAWLAAAGVDAVSLANNHTLDGGPDGLRETLARLADAGVAAVGAGAAPWDAVFLTTPGGARVAMLAATWHLSPTARRVAGAHPVAVAGRESLAERLPERVAETRRTAPDAAIVVLLHWGTEGAPRPDEGQVALAHALVDAGAALVVGHGAHVLHPVEAHAGGLIVYGAGDLLLDTGHAGAAALFDVTLERGPDGAWRARALTVHPLRRATHRVGPRPPAGPAAAAVLLPPQEGAPRAVGAGEPTGAAADGPPRSKVMTTSFPSRSMVIWAPPAAEPRRR